LENAQGKRELFAASVESCVLMPFAMKIRVPVLYVSWRGFTKDDLDSVATRIADLRRETSIGVVYVSRLPGHGSVFTDDDHAVLLRFLLDILPSCASIHHVIEGDGFLKSARRATVTNMALATPRPRDFYTYATLDEANVAVLHATGIDVVELARSGTPTPPAERASSAFRAAARIAVESRSKRPRE
jgi:hypothetical protein